MYLHFIILHVGQSCGYNDIAKKETIFGSYFFHDNNNN